MTPLISKFLAHLLLMFWPQYVAVPFTSSGGGSPNFTYIQGCVSSAGTSPRSCTFGSSPANGHLLIAGLTQNITTTALSTVSDGINNYTISVNSPSYNLTTGGAGRTWIAYILVASSAGSTVTGTWVGGGGTVALWVDEFAPPAGKTATFDLDNGTSSSQGNWNTQPTLTPTAIGELNYCVATVVSSITAPTAGGTSGSWTGVAGAITNGNMAEYILNSSNTATFCSFAPGQSQSSMMAAFGSH